MRAVTQPCGLSHWALLGSVSLTLVCGGCSPCSPSHDGCDGNEIVTCNCDVVGCAPEVVTTCDNGTVCREDNRRVACVLADERCPPERLEIGEYCDGNTLKTCFADYIRSATPCEPGWTCTEHDAGAQCVDDAPPCATASVLCESGNAFRICIGDWGPRNQCPAGTACDSTRPGSPCVPTSDAGGSSDADGG